MKRLTFIIIAICMIAGQMSVNAQNHGQNRPDPEKMVQMAADRMAKELALDDETTAKFTELYKAYLTDRFALMRDSRGMREPKEQGQNEESAAEQIVKNFERRQKMIELEQKQLNLDIQYCEKFNKILNPKQILKLYDRQNYFGRPMSEHRPQGDRPQGRSFQGGRPRGNDWPGSSWSGNGWDNE